VIVPDVVTGDPDTVRPVVPPESSTLVTVPVVELVPAPIAVRNDAASRAVTVLSALKRGKVMALGFVNVKTFAPTVDAPRLVRAVPASVAPVPPFATASVPANVIVPEVVMGDPDTVRPVVPPERATLVTVPEPPPVAAMVIDPVPFVMLIPDPAVSVALVSVFPVVLPIRS
jgi:hypothetical protein